MKVYKLLFLIIFTVYFSSGSLFAENPVTMGKSGTKHNKSATAGCVIPSTQTWLDLNNVRALIMTGGDMWWDLKDKSMYEVPKGSGKTALFSGAIWIGGTDVNNQLKLCAVKYRASGTDFWTGPLVESGPNRATVTSEVCLKYDKHWNITRTDVAKFRAWFNATPEQRSVDFPGYQIPDVILDWPAMGDTANHYAKYLAPFEDVDGDGSYDPEGGGDYPFYDLDDALPCGTSREQRRIRLFGDQTLWWVYNDKGNVHTDPVSDPVGMEIQAQAFAFATNDELNNMTFYNYALINRSTYKLQDTYFGVWTDADMGYAWDDFVGCDVNRGLGYLYNGDNVDGSGESYAYGGPTPPPPAIGMDFFEGPYQDADNLDNPTSWDTLTGQLICDNNILNGNINGLNFADGIVDNERWGMRRYLYFNNSAGVQGDPNEAIEYYNYLKGKWKDGTKMFYDGTGHYSDGATSDIPSDFMFPGDSDPCGWGEAGQPQSPWDEFTEDNDPDDRRLVQSAGPFTLEPGAVNDITVGAVWARASAGEPFESVEEVRRADDKAQLLFDNCFKMVNGPDAPEMKIIELDQKLIVHLYNMPRSNNYLEQYLEKDFRIINVDTDKTDDDNTPDVVDKYYRFEGYQVFQVKDSTVSITDVHDPDLARLVFQCDIKNGIKELVNYTWSTDLGANIPVKEVTGDSMDNGIKHSFVLTEDKFAQNAKTLVNYKKYYYIGIAYGYNNYMTYDQNDPDSYEGQKKRYLAGRKTLTGAIKAKKAIPHPVSPQNGGTVLGSTYDDSPKITQIYGRSSVANALEPSDASIQQIMSGEPWKINEMEYRNGNGPIRVKVVDPLNVPDGEYIVRMDSVSFNKYFFRIEDARWYIAQVSGSVSFDTIYSDAWISTEYEQIIAELGISVTISMLPKNTKLGNILMTVYTDNSTISYSDITKPWLGFLPDEESNDPFNWIRAGTTYVESDLNFNDYYVSGTLYDDDGVFEKMASGTWSPYKMVSHYEYGLAYDTIGCHKRLDFSKGERLSSVNVVITPDKTKWTRCVVIETSENDTTNTGAIIPGMSVYKQAYKFDMRRSPSVDKYGNSATLGSGPSNDPEAPNFIADNGMGWFPGYAIDVETGERLNMMFGEASELPGENGRDMLWNPTENLVTKLWNPYVDYYDQHDVYLLGGKHFVYVMGHNNQLRDSLSKEFPYMPPYDNGAYIYDRLSRFDMTGNSNIKQFKQSVYRNAMWAAIPLINYDYKDMTLEELLNSSEITIKLRVGTPISASISDSLDYDTVHVVTGDTTYLKYPVYTFNTNDIFTVKNDIATAKDALDMINIVPNPYYGYSPYEESQLLNLVKITNLPEKCTISIYSVNGILIRKFKKDNQITFQEWDLKNQYMIPIAGGVYIIHVKVEGVGEKIIKWFGALRPIDLNAY